MATRNLARTIIEGGRANWTKDARSSHNRKYRHYVNQTLRTTAIEDFDGVSWKPYREHVGIRVSPSDKLNPLWRYVAKFKGKPYNELMASLRKRFDWRNIRGYHLLVHVEDMLGTYPKTYNWRWNREDPKDVRNGIVTLESRSWRGVM